MDDDDGVAEPLDGFGDWEVLIDPTWAASAPGEEPPSEAMVGGRLLDEDGVPGPFQSNPDYQPSTEDGITDPTDAVLRMLARGDADHDLLLPTLRDMFVEIAVGEDGAPVIGPSPD